MDATTSPSIFLPPIDHLLREYVRGLYELLSQRVTMNLPDENLVILVPTSSAWQEADGGRLIGLPMRAVEGLDVVMLAEEIKVHNVG